jgi:hypothetical protein
MKKAQYKVKAPDINELQKRLFEQLKKAKAFRETNLEPEWANNYATVFASNTLNMGASQGQGLQGPLAIFEGINSQIQGMPDSNISIRYAFKYLRYLHSQAAANPPSVTFTPRTQDIQDRRTAEACTAFKEYARKALKVQDIQDWRSLEAILYGTGVSKLEFNPYAGDGEYNEEAESVLMKGAIEASPVSLWSFYRDPDAKMWGDVKWTFEAHSFDIEEAVSRWPDYEEMLLERKGKYLDVGMGTNVATEEWRKNLVQILEYNEAGLPWNGMAGRQCFCIVKEDKLIILGKMEVSPHPEACLPYQYHTDIDVPGRCEGKSFLDYISRLQELLDNIDTHILMSIQAHGSVKLVVWDDAGAGDDNESTDTYEIIKIKGQGNTPPMYVQPPMLMPDISRFRDSLIQGMEALAGMNEQMFGQPKREMSGYAVQNAINSANLTRHRFFVKYKQATEDFYGLYLLLAQKYMPDEEKINVTGEEEAYSLKYFSKADLGGKYDFSTDYGTAFSLDPESRQEQIMQLKDMLIAAGVSEKQIIRSMGLSDLKGVVDIAERAKKRQMEIFDKIEALFHKGVVDAATAVASETHLNEESAMMLEACTEYRTSALFQTFDTELQKLIDMQIDARKQAAAQVAATGQMGQIAPGGAPATPPMPGMPTGGAPLGGAPLGTTPPAPAAPM